MGFEGRAVLGQLPGRQLRRDGLETGPDRVALLQVGGRQIPHPDALVGSGLDQAQALQLPQGLPHGRLADLQLRGDAALHDALARLPAPADDPLDDVLADLFAQRVDDGRGHDRLLQRWEGAARRASLRGGGRETGGQTPRCVDL